MAAGGATPQEIMAAAAAHCLRDHQVAIIGIGLPQVAAFLARATHAPHLTLLLDPGIINPEPLEPAMGLLDPRIWTGASYFGGFTEVLGMELQRGTCHVGMLGGAEVDRHGNVNTSLVSSGDRIRYLSGSGGGNDIASLCQEVVILMKHERRRFPERVHFLTSPGFPGGRPREAWGLRGRGPTRVITDLAVLGFDPEHRSMTLLSVHPGVTLEQVQAQTGFELPIPQALETTPLPSSEELAILCSLDPQRVVLA